MGRQKQTKLDDFSLILSYFKTKNGNENYHKNMSFHLLPLLLQNPYGIVCYSLAHVMGGKLGTHQCQCLVHNSQNGALCIHDLCCQT